MSQWVKLKPVCHQVAIAGRVIDAEKNQAIPGDAEKNQAIPGARVQITKMPPEYETWLNHHKLQYGSNWNQMVERPDRRRTAADGSFYFMDLPDGEYILTASLPSAGTRYGTYKEPITVSRQDGNINASWEEGGNLAVNIALQPTAIKGQITSNNKNNEAVVMAKVQVEGSSEYTFSNSEGNYLLSGLEAPSQRTVKVSVSAFGYQSACQSIKISRGEVKIANFSLLKLTN